MNITKLKKNLATIILLFADILLLLVIFEAAKAIRIYILPHFLTLPPFHHKTINYIWIFVIYIIIFFYKKLYNKTFPFWDEIKNIIESITIAAIIILFIFFIGKISTVYSRTLIITYNVLLILLFPAIRLPIRKLLYKSGLFIKKALIIGSSTLAESIYQSIKNEPNLCYKISGFIDDLKTKKEIEGNKIHSGLNKIESYIKIAHITDVIIAKEDFSSKDLSSFINRIQHKAENVIYVPDIKGIAAYGTEIKYFFNQQTIAFEIKNNLSNITNYITKRVIDYIFSILIFFLILPIIIIIAILIKFTSEGSIIYSHKRIGKNGKEFNCYKFRTMYKDADEKLKEILESDPEKKKEWETYWKLNDDPRITPIGKFLRKTSLDEIPQIFNILKGEMSLVGPRPVVQREIDEYYKENADYYFKVPPGITGLWQVSGRSSVSYEYRVLLDSWYVKNWNLWLDIVILLKTIKAVIKQEGAR
ncbi:MAG: undecaprenyl-phosphate galactose phosphotransferase WbaP [Elusimicrobiota bacterium]